MSAITSILLAAPRYHILLPDDLYHGVHVVCKDMYGFMQPVQYLFTKLFCAHLSMHRIIHAQSFYFVCFTFLCLLSVLSVLLG